jgi:hypothetical protein
MTTMRRSLTLALAALAATALTVPDASPAHAVTRQRGMFFSTVTYDTANTFATNADVGFTHTSTGRYTFMATAVYGSGIPQLTMNDNDDPDLPICTISSVLQISTGTRLKVRCNSSVDGTAMDGAFNLFYSSYRTVDPSYHFVELKTTSTGSSTPSNQFRASGTGRARVKKLGTGQYRVRIPNESFPVSGGIMMVSATGTNSRWCNISYWDNENGLGGTDVYVNCFRRGGAPASATFSFIATGNTMLGRNEIPGGSVWSNVSARSSSHTDLDYYTFNSHGDTNTHANQILTGDAEVTFPNVFPDEAGVVARLVVAYGGSDRCGNHGLHGLDGHTVTTAVHCRTANNVAVDSSFDVMLEILIGS